jgi:hypothetical protein
MTDSKSPDDPATKEINEVDARKIFEKRLDRWIDENLESFWLHSEFAEKFIKKFIQKFGKNNDYAKLIQSELKKLRPKNRPIKNDDNRKRRVEAEYQLLRACERGWSRQECLEHLAIMHGYQGRESWKKVEKIITDARKITPHK